MKHKKKYYKEVPCKACSGSGSRIPIRDVSGEGFLQEQFKIMAFVIQGVCLGCEGKGTQTVLDREE